MFAIPSVDFRKISPNDHQDSAIVLRGLGTVGDPHPDFVSLLSDCRMEVYVHDRKGDTSLRHHDAIRMYCRQIQENVTALVASGKRVHLIGISFGGFLALKLVYDIQSLVRSVTTIAPIIDPYAVISAIWQHDSEASVANIKLANGSVLPISLENIDPLHGWKPEEISIPGMMIIGENDGVENATNITRITGSKILRHVLSGVCHEKTTEHTQTRALLRQFYKWVISL